MDTGDRALRVLTVDDEEAIRTFTQRALQLGGYKTAVAASGAEALTIAKDQGPFDLLLADVVMPEMMGAEVARRLRLNHPELKVLYFTGFSDRLFEEKTTLWENEAFLEKPVTIKGLLEAVSLLAFGHTRNAQVRKDVARRRSARVAPETVHVRVGTAVGTLMNISASGALVLLPEALASGREWPLVIELEQPVRLRTCVVRAHEVALPVPAPSGKHPECAVALAFMDLPPAAEEALKPLFAERFGKLE